MKIHELKIWPNYFEEEKDWEIRNNDRDFEPGDILVLREYYPTDEELAGLSDEAREEVRDAQRISLELIEEDRRLPGRPKGEGPLPGPGDFSDICHVRKILAVWTELPGVLPGYVVLDTRELKTH